MQYRAVLFDLDGTLLDTLEDLADSVNRVLAASGFPTHPVDAYRYFVGDGAAMLVRRALPERVLEDNAAIEACLAAFREDYGQFWRVKTKPYPGIPELLDALAERRVKRAVLSNKPHENTRQCVDALLPKAGFGAVLGQQSSLPRKPDPAGAFEVAAWLGTDPGAFLYLGDSGVDMQTALAAGMFPVGALWGFRPREELEANGARVCIASPGEVLDLLG